MGSSGTAGAAQWWMQTPMLPGGRPQFALQHRHTSLRYGAHAAGWSWQLQSKHLGVWWSPHRSMGLTAQFRGTQKNAAWNASGAWSPQGWTVQGQYQGITLDRSYQGQYRLGYHAESLRLDLNWGNQFRSFGLRIGDLEWRRSTSAQGTSDLLRLRRGPSVLEWRTSMLPFGTQQLWGIRTNLGPSRLWIQVINQGTRSQAVARLSYSNTSWGSAVLGYSSRQALLRYQLPDQSPLSGSYVEWASAATLNLAHRGRGFTLIWNPYRAQISLYLFARHDFSSKPKPQMVRPVESPKCWLDVTYSFTGQPPNVELEFRGPSTQRVVLLPQSRQWKDHLPPGRYAVTGTAPKGWKLELPKDSVELRAHVTQTMWVNLVPQAGAIRWISASGAAAE